MAKGRARTVLGILKGGKRLLQEVGWCKHESRKYKDGKIVGYCATGALNAACDPNASFSRSAAASLLQMFCGHSSVISFNDSRSTKKRQVLKVFDAAIAQEKKRLARGQTTADDILGI